VTGEPHASDGGVTAAIDFAAGAWARGGYLEPPAEITDLAARNRWRFNQGALREARELLDPLGDDPPVDSTSLRNSIARAFVIGTTHFGFDPLSTDAAIAAADAIVGEAVRHVERDAIQREANGRAAEEPPDTPRLTLGPRITLKQMDAEPLEFLAPQARGFPRGITTLLTGAGGTFKTRAMLQYLFAASLGEAPFGCPLLAPPTPLRCVYIGAEDGRRFFHYLARPLLAGRDDLAELPFDVLLLPDTVPGFTLSKATARELADFLATVRQARGGLDCVVLEPMLALMGREYADMMKNPVIARAFFIDCLQPLFAAGTFALITGNHDSKAGAAVTGSADQQNAGRLVLQFRRGEEAAGGLKSVIIEQVKDNVGFRFQEIVLEPDPETLALAWNEAASIYAYGAPTGQHTTSATTPIDPAAVMPYLCRLAAQHLTPTLVPAAERTKRRVEQRLTQHATRDGHHGVRQKVRDCLAAYCEWQPEPAEHRRGRRLVLCGVRNPNAPIGDFDDYLAGGPAPATPREQPTEEPPPCDA
jgi:hypothetical protein